MANVKIILYKSKTYKDGKHPIMIQVIHNRKVKRISINRKIYLEEWDEVNSMPYATSKYLKTIRAKVIEEETRISKVLMEIERDKPNYQLEDLIMRLGKPKTQKSCVEYMEELISRFNNSRRYGNANAYQAALNALNEFTANKNVLFSDIDYKFLVKWKEYHLSKGNSINGLNVYLRAIRASFNKAIAEEVISVSIYPFNKYRIVNETTIKRALSKEDLLKIISLDIVEDTYLWHSRNIFLFSFFSIGMSWADIAKLKKINLSADRIQYKRSKTGKDYSIKISDKMKAILDFYTDGKRNNDFIFPIVKRSSELEQYQDIRNELRNHNKRLEKIRNMAGINMHLTSYVARHTWASIANFSNVHIGIISQGLGHSDIKTTQIYLANFDHSEIDDANANII